MSSAIRLRCHCCNARIKAPAQLQGQTRNCPQCNHRLVIMRQLPEDCDFRLVYDDRLTPVDGR
jgi:hypothetical protein